jgi:hypothetical protein
MVCTSDLVPVTGSTIQELLRPGGPSHTRLCGYPLVLVFGVTAGIYARLNKAGTTVVTNGLYTSGPTHGVAR